MTWLRDRGIPTPRVDDVEGGDLVMELIPGPTMVEDLGRRPWRLVSHGRTLARLQRQINQLSAPAWLPIVDGVPEGPAVLHRDLHPLNVIMAPRGPVVIDWTNASRGDADHDAALTYLVMAAFEAQGARDRFGRRVLVREFARSRGRAAIDRGLRRAGELRLTDPNVTPGEARAIRRLLDG